MANAEGVSNLASLSEHMHIRGVHIRRKESKGRSPVSLHGDEAMTSVVTTQSSLM